MNTRIEAPSGVEILGTRNAQIDEILTPEAMIVVVDLITGPGEAARG